MKIVYISGTGLADSDFPLIRAYQQLGHEVMTFMTLAPQSLRSTLIDIRQQLAVNGVIKATEYKEFARYSDYVDMDKFYLIHRAVPHAMSMAYLKALRQCMKMIDEFKPDVVHVMSVPYTLDTLLYKYRSKMVLTTHDPFPHSGEQNFMREAFRKLAFRLCPKFVLLNGKQKDEFTMCYNIGIDRLLINRLGIYNAIDCFVDTDIRASLSSNNVLFFGRISPYKGVEYLLEAMKIVHRAIPSATVTIAGGGKMYFDVSEYKNLDYVEIVNRYVGMEELTKYLANAAVTICPYTDATQSGVVLTSFAMEKPVIASNVGGMSEYITEGKTGKLIPAKNPQALADAIVDFFSKQDERTMMSAYLHELKRKSEDDWKSIAQKYIDFYKKT